MIVSKRRHLLKDVQAIRHVDIDNDHNLVIAKICIKMRKAKGGSSNSTGLMLPSLKTRVSE